MATDGDFEKYLNTRAMLPVWWRQFRFPVPAASISAAHWLPTQHDVILQVCKPEANSDVTEDVTGGLFGLGLSFWENCHINNSIAKSSVINQVEKLKLADYKYEVVNETSIFTTVSVIDKQFSVALEDLSPN